MTYREVELLTHVVWQDRQAQAKGVCWLGPVPQPHIADPSAQATPIFPQLLSAATSSATPLQLPPPLEPGLLATFQPPLDTLAPVVADATPSPQQRPPLSASNLEDRHLSPVPEELVPPAPSFLARMASPLDRTLLPTKLDKVITAILGFPGALIGGFIGLIVGLISAPFTKVGLKQSVQDGMLSFALWGSLVAPPFIGTLFAGGLFLLNKCLHTPTRQEIAEAAQYRGGPWSLGRS